MRFRKWIILELILVSFISDNNFGQKILWLFVVKIDGVWP